MISSVSRLDWLSREEIIEYAGRFGRTITPSQLDVWRKHGLLPEHRRERLGQGRGSPISFAPAMAPQALRIAEMLDERRKLDEVGWRLWTEGFPVDERHWQPTLQAGAQTLDTARTFLRRVERGSDSEEETFYDRHAADIAVDFPTPQRMKRFQGLDRDTVTAGISSILRVSIGRVSERDLEADATSLQVPLRLTGLFQATPIVARGERWKGKETLPWVLGVFAEAFLRVRFAAFLEKLPRQDLEAARDDVRRLLRLAKGMVEMFRWTHGPNAFGLRAAVGLIEMMKPEHYAMMVLLWAKVRKLNKFFDAATVENLIRETEVGVEDAKRHQQLARTNRAINPKALKWAMPDPSRYHAYLQRVQAGALALDARAP